MKNETTKKVLRRIKRRNKIRVKYEVNKKSEYNIKYGEVYQRIHYLLNLAITLYKENPSLANLYVSIMKDIIKKNAIRADSKFKKLICGNCNNLIFIDENTEIKLQSKLLYLGFLFFR